MWAISQTKRAQSRAGSANFISKSIFQIQDFKFEIIRGSSFRLWGAKDLRMGFVKRLGDAALKFSRHFSCS
jgi:hypothetical protein